MFGSSTEALTTISELSGAKGSSGDRTIDQVWRVVVKQIMWAWGDDEAAEDSLNEEMMYFFEDDELEDFMNKLIAEQGTGWELKCLLLALASTQILTAQIAFTLSESCFLLLLDSGAQGHFVKEDLVQELNLTAFSWETILHPFRGRFHFVLV
eukprot:TRINITY_DN9155_c0_g1_i3.p2 TRINITY_DN9155_c0_g1~~TRINITY_DN9155_c0_g1_i3.p2  ORF type:complete len:153 (-),score=24.53 TRINITY_DN9155_c0_g1_i3:306-764(-)